MRKHSQLTTVDRSNRFTNRLDQSRIAAYQNRFGNGHDLDVFYRFRSSANDERIRVPRLHYHFAIYVNYSYSRPIRGSSLLYEDLVWIAAVA